MARSAKPRKQKSSRQSSRSAPPVAIAGGPCTGGIELEAGSLPPSSHTTVHAAPHTAVHVNTGTDSAVPAVISDPAS